MYIKIYIAAAVVGLFLIGALVGHLWSSHEIRSLEAKIDTAKMQAAEKQNSAVKAEKAAAEYKQKIEYLEQSLADLQAIAIKQDEELEKLTTNTANARADVERARRVRAIASTTNDELCRKLAEVGHACE